MVLSEIPYGGLGQEDVWLSAGMCRASFFRAMSMGMEAQVQNSTLYSPLGKMHDEVVIIVLDESQDSCPLML